MPWWERAEDVGGRKEVANGSAIANVLVGWGIEGESPTMMGSALMLLASEGSGAVPPGEGVRLLAGVWKIDAPSVVYS